MPHGDNHDLWIASDDPDRMINANDGGGNVSINGGRTWTDQDYPTAQFYRVDHHGAHAVSHLRRPAGQLDGLYARARLESHGGPGPWHPRVVLRRRRLRERLRGA